MQRRRAGLLLAAPVFFLLTISLSRAAPAQSDLKLGVIVPLSGIAAHYGAAVKNGIELALQDLGENRRVKVIFEDFRFEPALAVSAFRHLSEIEKVDAVIVVASTPSNAVAPLAEARQMPLLAWASDPHVTRGRKYALRTYPSGETEGETVAREALRKGLNKAGVFYVVSDYAASTERGFRKVYPSEQVLISEETPQNLQDFRSFISRAKALQVESFFLCLEVGQNGLFARQARELKMQATFFGCENLNNLQELKISEGALKDAFFSTVGVTDEFRRRYKSTFGNEDVLSGAAIHYDLVKLLNATRSSERNSGELIQNLFDAGEIKGALPSARFVRTADDQFLDVRLVTKSVSELGVE